MHTAVVAPQGVWWKPAAPQEKKWVTIAFIWCMVLFAMMPLWHWRGGQNPSGTRTTVRPEAFSQRVDEFIRQYQVGEEKGLPIVAPPPGAEIYVVGGSWQWKPILRLEEGVEYTLHLSSTDFNHGFSLFPVNLNFQVVPGYDYALKIRPNAAGDFAIVCNEYCGAGHHIMVGKVVVTPARSARLTEEAAR